MKNNLFPIISSMLLFTLIAACQEKKHEQKNLSGSRPNIIFILTDDQGYGDLSRHGNPVLKTINMDRLHDESVRFTDFMVSPTCAPTRCAIFSGMHEFKSGVSHTIMGRNKMDLGHVTMAEILHSAGYTTGLFGKWHLGLDSAHRPDNRGFDIALTELNENSYKKYFDPELMRNGVPEEHKGYRTNILFNEAIKFIEENAMKKRPFFCYLATYVPHAPLEVPEEYSNRYDGNKFFGMIACLDDNIGIMLQKLEELGIENNTLLILINDNGATFGTDTWNANMRGVKTTAWYGGTRAISFWRWPGMLTPADVESLTAHVDLLPTLADLAGAKIPKVDMQKLDGRSMVPLLESPEADWPDRPLFTHVGRWNNGDIDTHKYCQCNVRYGRYALVRIEVCDNPDCHAECRIIRRVRDGGEGYYSKKYAKIHYAMTNPGRWALYDIKSDILQEHDIAAQHPEIVNKLSSMYEQWWEEVYPKIN